MEPKDFKQLSYVNYTMNPQQYMQSIPWPAQPINHELYTIKPPTYKHVFTPTVGYPAK
jgi:hypothetical protein